MKKRIAILFLLLLLVQAIPVAQLLVSSISTFTIVDEDKPTELKVKETKEVKEYECSLFTWNAALTITILHCHGEQPILPTPFLESPTPPPNARA